MDSDYLINALRQMESHLCAVLDGQSAGPERRFACPEQRAEVSFFNTPNADDEPLFDIEVDDLDKGPVFDAEPIPDHVAVSVFEFVRPEDKVPLVVMELGNLTTACLSAVFDQETSHDDFVHGPVFDEEPHFDIKPIAALSSADIVAVTSAHDTVVPADDHKSLFIPCSQPCAANVQTEPPPAPLLLQLQGEEHDDMLRLSTNTKKKVAKLYNVAAPVNCSRKCLSHAVGTVAFSTVCIIAKESVPNPGPAPWDVSEVSTLMLSNDELNTPLPVKCSMVCFLRLHEQY